MRISLVTPKILISACLLGHKVRYDGKDNLQNNSRLQALIKAGGVVSICPEMAGGLPTPRPPAELQGSHNGLDAIKGQAKVITIDQQDVTAEYVSGANQALRLAQQHNIKVAILKARSPSCGSSQIYDGSFTRTLTPGIGITAALLSKNGIQVFDEEHIDEALNAAGVE